MRRLLVVLVLLLITACGDDILRPDAARPPDARVDAPRPPDAAVDATPAPDAAVDAAVIDAAPAPDALPVATPNYGAACATPADCEGDLPCQFGVCYKACFVGSCSAPLVCHSGYCVWPCSSEYACPAETSCLGGACF